MATYHGFMEENFPATFQTFEEALTIADEAKDVVSLYFTNYWFGVNLSVNCEFEKATEYMQRALDISVAAGNLWGIASTKATFVLHCFFYPGRMNLEFRTSVEAVRMAEESGDSYSKGIAYTCHGALCFGRGLFEEAENHLLKGATFCERINLKIWNFASYCYIGEVYFERGDFPKSEECFGKAFRLLKDSGLWPSFVAWANVGLIKAKSMINPKDIDLESLYARSKNIKVKVFQGLIPSSIGAILMTAGDEHLPEAEAWIQKAIEQDQKNGTRFFLGRDYALYAEWHKRNGDHTKARENLGRAIEILKECGADGWVEKYEKERALIL